MFAIVNIGGKQYRIKEGDVIQIDKVSDGHKAGDPIKLNDVLLVSDAHNTVVGKPYVAGALVEADIVEPLVKGEKLIIFKYKPKKRFRRKVGHRQKFTTLAIRKINVSK